MYSFTIKFFLFFVLIHISFIEDPRNSLYIENMSLKFGPDIFYSFQYNVSFMFKNAVSGKTQITSVHNL